MIDSRLADNLLSLVDRFATFFAFRAATKFQRHLYSQFYSLKIGKNLEHEGFCEISVPFWRPGVFFSKILKGKFDVENVILLA